MLLKLTDSTGQSTLPELEVPFTILPIEGAVDVQTLSFDVYTDFVTQKRTWTQTYAFLTKEDFDLVKGYYDRQFVDYTYPQLSIEESVNHDVTNIVCRMTMTAENLIDNCETVSNVTISFRETRQLGS
jgi:hypothetical protein